MALALCVLSLIVGLAAPPAPARAADSADSIYRRAEEKLATRNSDDLAASLDLFLEATRLDPAHARAHAGAATAASLLALYSVAPPQPLFRTAREQAQAALRLDPGLAAAQAAMGLVEYLDAWNFVAAETRLREAVRLDPSYAQAWHWYGMMLMATARFDESLAAFERAIALDPGSALYAAKHAGVEAAAARTDAAERELRAAVERFPRSGLAQRELGYLLIGSGRTGEGVAALRRSAELSGIDPKESADLAWGCARGGQRAEAEAIVARLLEQSRRAESFVSPLDLALAYAGLERADDAFQWLDRAVAIRDPGLVYLATAPGFAPLRADARFGALLASIGLPSRETRHP